MPEMPEYSKSSLLSDKTPIVDIYLRLSDDRHDGRTFEQREAECRAQATRRGFEVRRVVIENDVMAKTRRGGSARRASAFKRQKIRTPDGQVKMRVIRPGFRSIVNDIIAGRIQGFVAEDLDRAMRDPRDLEDLIDAVQATKAWAFSLSGSLQFTAGGTDAEITLARVMVAFANKASRDTSRRCKAARLRAAHAGAHVGRRPYGFEKDGVTLRKDEADEVRRWAEQVLNGVPLREIALGLNDRRVPSPTGAAWRATGIRQMLLRPRTGGVLVHRPDDGGGTRRDYLTGQWDIGRLPNGGIIPEDMWRRLVALLNDPSRRLNKSGPAAKRLGSGIYRCCCGDRLYSSGSGNTLKYRCYSIAKGAVRERIKMQHTSRRIAHLDEYVVSELLERLCQPDAAELFLPAATPEEDINGMRAELRMLRERETDLADEFAAGTISRTQLVAGTTILRQKIEQLEGALHSVQRSSAVAGLVGHPDVESARAVWDRMTLGDQRAILRTTVDVQLLPCREGQQYVGPDSVVVTFSAPRQPQQPEPLDA